MFISRANVAAQMHEASLRLRRARVQPARAAWHERPLQRETDAGASSKVDKGRPRLLLRRLRGVGARAGRHRLRRAHHALQLDRRHAGDVRGLRPLLWKPMSFNASRGDGYLDEENHTAMCIRATTARPTCWAKVQHQRDRRHHGEPATRQGTCESWIHDYYSGHWDGILHYTARPTPGRASAPTGFLRHLRRRFSACGRGVIAGEFEMAMQEGRRSDRATTRCRRRVNRIPLGGSSGAPRRGRHGEARDRRRSSATATSGSGAWATGTVPCRGA